MLLESKLSMKSIGAQPKAGAAVTDGPVAQVYGRARSFSTGTTHLGQYIKFRGDFEAVNLATGEVYRSQNLLLPEIASALLAEALKMRGASSGTLPAPGTKGDGVPGTDASTPIEFAFEIGLNSKTATTPGGAAYEYTVRPLMDSRETDSLADLRAQVPRLGAPVQGQAAQDQKPDNDQTRALLAAAKAHTHTPAKTSQAVKRR